MTLFQIIVLILVAVCVATDVVRARRSLLSTKYFVARIAVWIAVGIAVSFPGSVQALASFVGIGRGADVVLYGLVLAFLAVSFYFYSRQTILQRQLTQLVRSQAIANAQCLVTSSQPSKSDNQIRP